MVDWAVDWAAAWLASSATATVIAASTAGFGFVIAGSPVGSGNLDVDGAAVAAEDGVGAADTGQLPAILAIPDAQQPDIPQARQAVGRNANVGAPAPGLDAGDLERGRRRGRWPRRLAGRCRAWRRLPALLESLLQRLDLLVLGGDAQVELAIQSAQPLSNLRQAGLERILLLQLGLCGGDAGGILLPSLLGSLETLVQLRQALVQRRLLRRHSGERLLQRYQRLLHLGLHQ